MFNIEIYYKDNKINFVDFDRFLLSDSLDNDENHQITLTIPYNKSNDILFQPPFEFLEVKINDKNYYFVIKQGGIQKSDKTIKISCKPKLLNDLNIVLSKNINKTNYNPILAVKEIFDSFLISYNNYSFEKNIKFFDSLNLFADVVFIKTNSVDVRLFDFVNEVFKIFAVKLCFDIEGGELYIYNPLESIAESEFLNGIIENRYIKSSSIKETELKDFYNSFNIAVLFNGKTTARFTVQYLYECAFFEGTDYFNEDDIETDFPIVKLKRDIILNGVTYLQNDNQSGGVMTGKSQVYNSDLSSDVVNSGLWSQKYYDTTNEFKVDFAKDSYSFCRISGDVLVDDKAVGIKPTLDLGGLILSKFYKKLNLLEFEYSKKLLFIAGERILFNNKKYILASQELKSNRKNLIKLLEVL